MTPAAAIARLTARRLLRWRRLLLFGALELAPAGVFLLSTTATGTASASRQAVEVAAGLVFPLLVPVVSLVFAAGALGNERRDGTLSFLVLRPLRRWQIGAAGLAAALVGALVLDAVGVVAFGLAHAAEAGSVSLLVPLLVGTAVTTALYVAIFVPLGFLTDRAVLLGLVFVFVYENGVAAALGSLASLSPWRIGMSAFAALAPPEAAARIPIFALGDLAPSLGRPVLTAALLLVAATLLLGALLRRRDLA
jgi:Putative exporter of polyketide antibiotics